MKDEFSVKIQMENLLFKIKILKKGCPIKEYSDIAQSK